MRAATSNVPPRRNVRHDASPQLLSSFHWGCDDAFGFQNSALDRNSEGRRLKTGEWRQLELRTPCEKFLATPLIPTVFVVLETTVFSVSSKR